MQDVIVIGAGAAGFSAALELADRGHKVKLIEQGILGSGSSGRNPGRMGHGFHYVDLDTAKMYLRASIEVQRKYPDYLVGKERPFDDAVRHGRYFITKKTDSTKEQILETYQGIKEEYLRLIKEDPANEVFGSPDKFYRILDPAEYEGLVNPEIVDIGVETAEHLFHWQSFVTDIKEKILNHKNITLYENTEVMDIKRGDLDEARFSIHVKEKGQKENAEQIFHTDYVVNSAWQNIEKLNEKVGIPMVQGARTNRLKSLLIVKLPESLVNANSMFFCMGQHCMYSNLGNGYGMMTFANETNMEAATGVSLSDRGERLLSGGATQEEKDDIAQKILAGVANYIPEMANATIIDLKFGVVQTAGALTLEDLKNPNSSFHKRDYDGIREEQVGLISNPCMKLFYFVRNGNNVADIVEAEIIATQVITQCMADIEAQAKSSNIDLQREIKKTILANMERSISSKTLTPELGKAISLTVFQTLANKKNVMDELSKENSEHIKPSM